MIHQFVRALASLKLTVLTLCAGLILVFIGTIAQVDQGLYQAQTRFFRSVFIYATIPGIGLHIPVFPGGYLVGTILLANLLTSQLTRARFTLKNSGLLAVHAGIILLLIGQLTSDLMQVESHMRLEPGHPRNYSESGRSIELVVIDTSDPAADQVISLPESRLASSSEIQDARLPFTIKVKEYHANSRLSRREAGNTNSNPVTQGVGQTLNVKSMPATVKTEERNLPSAMLEFSEPQGSAGVWLVSAMLDETQPVPICGKTYQVALRFARFYKPFQLELREFRHDKYQGTEIPKNFSSRVRVLNPATKEDREVLIYMNNPLRYQGETFYQSGYDENDPRVTILQVVRNPGWLIPYISCTLVSLGLTWHFMLSLAGFLKERRTA